MFMEPQITESRDWWKADTQIEGIVFVPFVECPDANQAHKVLGFMDAPISMEKVTGHGARLSAPGYMDCTDWAVFPTEAEAAQHLLDMHFGGPFDEMSKDEFASYEELLALTVAGVDHEVTALPADEN